MRTKGKWWSVVLLAIVLGLPFAGTPQAQTKTTIDVRKFEIIAVDGNNLVVRNESGTHRYAVPDDFRFMVDGRKLAVKELKPGMKGTATVTTKTTTITPVTVTEIKEGTVVSATDHSVNVRGAEGVRRFTQSQLDDQDVQILKDGRLIHIRDLRKGDQITATFISKAPPVVLTETEVQATLAQAASPAPAAAAAAPTQAAAAPQPDPAPPASPAPATTSPPQPPTSEGTPWVWYILIAIALALLWLFLARKKAKS